MTWLVVRQIRRPEEAFLEAAANRLAPGASFYHLTVNGMPIGNAGITLDTTLTGYRLTEVWSLDVSGTRETDRHVLRSDAILTRSFKLQEQAVSLSEARIGRTMELEQEDSTVTVRQRRAGGPFEMVALLAGKDVTIPAALPFRLVVEKRLERGGTFSQSAAAPFTGRLEMVAVRVGEGGMLPVSDSAAWDSSRSAWIPVPATERAVWLVERTWGGMPVHEWVDQQGHVVRRTWAFGLSLERSPFEVNYNMYQAALRDGSITLPRMPGDRLRTALAGRPDTSVRIVRAVLARTDGPAWPGAAAAFSGGRQSVTGDTVTITRSAPDGASPPEAEYLTFALRPAPLVVALREAVSGTGPAPADTLAALVHWVRQSVRLGGEDAASEPLGAVRSRSASAEGKVRLLVALARVAGLPARPVTGVDLGRPELPAHVWAEIWSGGRWVSADPVYGQLPAAASLLRVAEGANPRPLALLPLVASLKTTLLTIPR
jgi:transglutaminase-like putative cysteine protease